MKTAPFNAVPWPSLRRDAFVIRPVGRLAETAKQKITLKSFASLPSQGDGIKGRRRTLVLRPVYSFSYRRDGGRYAAGTRKSRTLCAVQKVPLQAMLYVERTEEHMTKQPSKQSKGYKKPLSKKMWGAIDLLISGAAKTQGEAAKKAGVTREALNKALNNPNHTPAIQERVNQRIRSAGMVIAAGSLQSLAQSANSEAVQADVSKHILSIGGVNPARGRSHLPGSITLNIILGDEAKPPGRVIDHEPGEGGVSLQVECAGNE